MATRGHIIGGGAYIHKRKTKYVLAVIDLDTLQPEPALCEMSFLGHGISIDPVAPDHAAIFEKKGPGACYVDLERRRVVQRITTAKNRHFYGHGAYSRDGALLYAAEALLEDAYKGMLVVRDGRTFERLGEFPSYGTAPHDCLLIDDGNTLVITNGGGPIDSDDLPCVSFVDVRNQQLLDKVELASPRFNTGHVAMTRGRDMALVSAPRDGLGNLDKQLGAVSLKLKDQPIRTMSEPRDVVERMLGETLSVVINEADDTVMCTHPLGNQISMWDLRTGALKGATRVFTDPRGIEMTLDHKYYVVSHKQGNAVCLSFLDATTREQVPGWTVSPSFTSGSHILAYDLASTRAS